MALSEKKKNNHKEYLRKRYNEDEVYRAAHRELVRQRRKSMSQWLREYKTGKKCQSCDETHPACLDFHHRPGEVKVLNLSATLGKGWSKERMMAEIAKCDILCSNCHRKLHDQETP